MIKEILKIYRMKYHYSQTKMANLLNVTQSSISKFESGEQVPDVSILIKYCELFHISMDTLCGLNSTVQSDKLISYLASHSEHEIEIMYDLLEAFIDNTSNHIL